MKINGNKKLIKCRYYIIDGPNGGKAVSIHACDYGAQLPCDIFNVSNKTNYYLGYFGTESTTVTEAHPLFKYVRAAAIKGYLREALPYAEKLKAHIQSGGLDPQEGKALLSEAACLRTCIANRRDELASLPSSHPTSAELAGLADAEAVFSARRAI